MADTDKIRNMLDNLINNKAEDAQINFHDYLQGKMKEVTGLVDPTAADDSKDSNGE